jgi:hypothetical protein
VLSLCNRNAWSCSEEGMVMHIMGCRTANS